MVILFEPVKASLYWPPQILPPINVGCCGFIKVISSVFAGSVVSLLSLSHIRVISYPLRADCVAAVVVAEVMKMAPSPTYSIA